MYVSMCIYINNNSNNNSNSMTILINLIFCNILKSKKKRMCGFKCRRTTYNSKGYYR